ncbi:MAG: trypsin-like peptidase domain-containing protein [Hyphomicrobiales bacterium]
MRIFWRFLLGLALLVPHPAYSQARPPGYADAAQAFQQLALSDRIKLQMMLTMAQVWPSVPNENFSGRLFDAIARFQREQGFPTTGYLTPAQFSRLTQISAPVSAQLGFRAIRHPDRGHILWVPMGLGLEIERTPQGYTFSDPRKRVKLDYEYYPGFSLAQSYGAWMSKLAANGAKLNYQALRGDFFAIVAEAGSTSWYIRFHQDGPGILGFALEYLNADQSIPGYAMQTLISASMWSSMSPGALPLEPPAIPLIGGNPALETLLTPPPLPAPSLPPTQPAVSVDTSPKVEPSTSAPQVPPKETIGTGFFVSKDGNIVTNAHVVDGCGSVEISSPNGPVSSRIVARDARNDLALLKADLTSSKVAGLRTGVRLGEQVAAFGYPLVGVLSTSGNFTLGNVTALTGIADDTRYLQVSVPVQPGNSGGPLLDANGNLVGVVTGKLDALRVMVATRGDIPQNVNFAIKGSVVATFLESNSVSFTVGTETAALAPADLATLAKLLSVRVDCK